VYRGRVANVMDFGAFVELQGMRAKAEGLVHVSEINKTRSNSAKELLKRGQDVWVKVLRISTAGGKQQLSLSMRDVDQVGCCFLLRAPEAVLSVHGLAMFLDGVKERYFNSCSGQAEPRRSVHIY